MPKKIFEDLKNSERFSDICGAISRYYNSNLEIPIEWVKEYNDLIKNI